MRYLVAILLLIALTGCQAFRADIGLGQGIGVGIQIPVIAPSVPQGMLVNRLVEAAMRV